MVDHGNVQDNSDPDMVIVDLSDGLMAALRSDQDQKQLIFQYEQLRKEILQNDTSSLQILGAVSLLVGAIVTVAFASGVQPQTRGLLLLSANALVVVGHSQRISLLERTNRIATYLRIFVEPHLDHVKWESRMARFAYPRRHTPVQSESADPFLSTSDVKSASSSGDKGYSGRFIARCRGLSSRMYLSVPRGIRAANLKIPTGQRAAYIAMMWTLGIGAAYYELKHGEISVGFRVAFASIVIAMNGYFTWRFVSKYGIFTLDYGRIFSEGWHLVKSEEEKSSRNSQTTTADREVWMDENPDVASDDEFSA